MKESNRGEQKEHMVREVPKPKPFSHSTSHLEKSSEKEGKGRVEGGGKGIFCV